MINEPRGKNEIMEFTLKNIELKTMEISDKKLQTIAGRNLPSVSEETTNPEQYKKINSKDLDAYYRTHSLGKYFNKEEFFATLKEKYHLRDIYAPSLNISFIKEKVKN